MLTTINRIVALSGPLPDEAAHRRWLGTLTPEALNRRRFDLEAEEQKKSARVKFWNVRLNRTARGDARPTQRLEVPA